MGVLVRFGFVPERMLLMQNTTGSPTAIKETIRTGQ
jgi:hypothetical protein